MKQLTQLLKEATSRISRSYFKVDIDGGAPVYRERVYCYELYHQLRRGWPSDSKFRLNGELDKAGHPKLREVGADRAKPDLLVHQPGAGKGNYAIIEVKTPGAQADGIRKDLNTLSLFTRDVGYERGIYLLFGYDAASAAERVDSQLTTDHNTSAIELWLHEAPEKAAARRQFPKPEFGD